jgi:acyl-CoA synthetase (AMP-forming)/AMP-acid ligase II
MRVLTIEQLLNSRPIDPVETDDDDLAFLQLTSGSTGSPKAVRISHANFVANAEAMFAGANVDIESDVIVSWLPCFHDMGMTGYLTVPMYYGAELVKVTPLDFVRDTLLWAKLIDKYKGTMTAAPNFAYALFAKRLRRQAQPGQFDLSTLRWALSGAEQVEPADVEDLIDAGRPFGLRPEAILPAYGMAEVARQLRGSLLEVLSSQYVRTLHAKGLSMTRILWQHGLKNVSVNLFTIISLLVNRMLAATVVVEAVFAIPGLGSLIVRGAIQRDFPIVQGVVFAMVIVVILVNLVADLLCAAVDPRIEQ